MAGGHLSMVKKLLYIHRKPGQAGTGGDFRPWHWRNLKPRVTACGRKAWGEKMMTDEYQRFGEVPTLRKPRRVGQPLKGGPARRHCPMALSSASDCLGVQALSMSAMAMLRQLISRAPDRSNGQSTWATP